MATVLLMKKARRLVLVLGVGLGWAWLSAQSAYA
jgi:hypothetical protein